MFILFETQLIRNRARSNPNVSSGFFQFLGTANDFCVVMPEYMWVYDDGAITVFDSALVLRL